MNTVANKYSNTKAYNI